MPDRNPNPPRNWSDAFALLPQETPPADGWARMAASLAARQGESAAASDANHDGSVSRVEPARIAARSGDSMSRRGARPHPARRWAIAAMLAAALPLGLWLSLRAQRPALETPSSDAIAQRSDAQAARSGDGVVIATDTNRADSQVAHNDSINTGRNDATPNRTAVNDTAVVNAPSPQSPKRAPLETDRSAVAALATGNDTPKRAATEHRASPTNAVANDSASTHDAIASQTSAANTTTTATAATLTTDAQRDTRIADQLRDLQAESAQLETLIALTRDDRVASASAALMSSDLDERLRLIDTTLTGSALPEQQRLSLWRQRVGALRALAGVESTQRWFAARGERYEDALVRVD